MKHTASRKAKERTPVTLAEARARIKGLTQLDLEKRSGVDRTRISKLEILDDVSVMHDTYEKLDEALRELGALRAGEKLVFGPAKEQATA
ncbi:MAG TPA: hypothetical protein VNG73_11190 [Gemmatimonadaceae bacterium]|nr:hypothetical protein [Gemmatimonadaceae bacterium]